MKYFRIIIPLALFTGAAMAQNGLRDLPDTAVEAQLEAFQLPEGAEINLFASEPMVRNPIHMNWDPRGRLWVVGSPLYPQIQPGQEESDTLVVLEDSDGDGVADKSTVFADDLHIPTGVLPGDGGVYVANSTEILFLEDRDGDGKADHRRVVLSGFGTEDTHHLVHTLRWGPEGQMWFNQSLYIHTHLETPYGVRRLLAGGMWHFHPETRRAEIFMRGLINPWGHAFDRWGQSFLTDGAGSEGINFVFPHSVFKGARGAERTLSGLNPGQPKHCGLEVLTGRHVPEEYRSTLVAPDFRGNRINRFRLTDQGSAYLSTQEEDLVASNHRAFRPIDVKMGPDGAIYVADLYNPIIQHGEVDFRDPRRDHEHGRIWRITFPERALVEKPDLANASPEELADALHAPEGWTREMARVEMRERDPDAVEQAIRSQVLTRKAEPDLHELRKLWALQTLRRFAPDTAARLAASENPKVRAAALRALYYNAADIPSAFAVAEKAVADPHPRVRLWAVSLLAQLDHPDTVATALRALDGVEVDDFLDFAVWSICREQADRWTDEAGSGGNPFANRRQLFFAARALGEPIAIPQVLAGLDNGEFSSDDEIAEVAEWIGKVGGRGDLDTLFRHALADGSSPAQQRAILDTLSSAGRLRKIQPEGDIDRLTRFLASEDVALFSSAAALAGQWKLESARPALEEAFLSAEKNEDRARAALEGLGQLGGKKSAAFLARIAQDADASFQLRSLATIGRAKGNYAAGARLALPVLRDAPGGADPHGLYETFLSNAKGRAALAKILKGEKLPEAVALTGVRKASAAATRPEQLIAALREAGGIEPMKMALSDEEMEAMMQRVAELGDPRRGESIYRRGELQCVVCHAIGGVGGVIGPDLVSIGASAPVDYLVDSLLQPSVKIKEGYHTTLVTTKNGDAFAGAVAREDGREVVVRDATGTEHRIAKSDVAEQTISPVSLMPPGLTAQLTEDEFADLVRFLSELGKEGEFKTPSNRYLREWKVLAPHERTRDAVGHQGRVIFAEDIPTYEWSPLFAKVNGFLPADECPEVVGRGKNRYAVGRTFLDVAEAGKLRFRVSGDLANLNLFLGEKEIPLPESGEEAEVEADVKEAGQARLTVSALRRPSLEGFRVELLDGADKVVESEK